MMIMITVTGMIKPDMMISSEGGVKVFLCCVCRGWGSRFIWGFYDEEQDG